MNLPDLSLTARQQRRMHDLYRQLHANPELSMQENATAELILRRLDMLGAETFRCGGTGVVGILRNGSGPVVAFRADMDGLPVLEETGLEYASTSTGVLFDKTEVPVMHACGHDVHMAAALTAAELLNDARETWAGTVVFVFQPGEETATGATAMVEDGLWEKAPRPEIIYGQHVMPQLSGEIHMFNDTVMAMADSWKVTVHAQGGHGSRPQDGVDPIVLGAHIVVRVQAIIAREIDPQEPAVVTIGTFHAGLKENVIPASAEFTVNVRTLKQAVRHKVLDSLRRVIQSEAAASGAPEPTIEEMSTFPLCRNDLHSSRELLDRFYETFGADMVRRSSPLMISEDFGVLGEAIGVPSVYWTFGGHPQFILDQDRLTPANHSSQFAPIVEPTLATGARAACIAIQSKVATDKVL